MKKEEVINEFWSHTLICLILYVSLMASYISAEKKGDYTSWIMNGCIYTAPCIVEGIRFSLFESKKMMYSKWIEACSLIILVVTFIYIFFNIYVILKEDYSRYIKIKLTCAVLYPMRSFMFAFYYFICSFCAKEDSQ